MKRVSVSSEVAANGCIRNLLIDKNISNLHSPRVYRLTFEEKFSRDAMIGTDSNFNNNYTYILKLT